MADESRIVITSEPTIGVEEVARRTFATSFRGFDPNEVRTFLKRVSDELASSREREKELRRRAEEAERRAAHPRLDEETLTAALGEETARVLRSAREAATDITARAEQKVARMVKEAQEEATRIRAEAETVLVRRVDEAEEVAGGIRRSAESDAEATRARAASEAEAELEAARVRGREMVVEAQALREKVLGDLGRRRRLAQAQVDQLRAGRERLLEAYRLVRQTLDQVVEELASAEVEARAAAEAAGRRAAAQAEASLEELEAELAGVEVTAAEPEAAEPPEPAPPPPIEAVAVEPPPAEEPEPEPEPEDERRSSSVKILRRPQPEGEAVELVVLEPPAADESVRVLFDRIKEEAEPVPPPPVVEEDEPPEAQTPVDDVDEGLLQRRDELLEPVDTALVRRLKRALQDDQNALLDALRTGRGRPAADVLPDELAHAARYRDVARPLLAQAAEAGVVFATGQVDAGAPDLERLAADLATDLAAEIVGPLRDRVARSLAESAGAADDDEGVAELVNAAYREWKLQRIEPAARHAAAGAFTRAGFAATADGTELRWIVDDEGGSCPDCDDDALAGPVPKGEPFPTGQHHPPAHPGCRCLLVPAR
jgi:DivIVA domain-containing protein